MLLDSVCLAGSLGESSLGAPPISLWIGSQCVSSRPKAELDHIELAPLKQPLRTSGTLGAMSQQPGEHDGVPLIEALHNGFYYFLQALEKLKEEPERQCQLMGDYNTAWELRSDVAAGRHLIGNGFLDADDEKAIAALADAVDAVPVNTLPGGAGRERNLAAMRHIAWIPLREQAAKLCIRLQPAAARSYLYLNLPPDLPRSGLRD